jgi:O-6-methylguanine DNA methyltransferase
VISLWLEPIGGTWYGVASHGDRLVATATGQDREDAERSLCSCLPRKAPYRVLDEGSEHARSMARLLARLEAGEAEAPEFELCPDCVREPLASVAKAASAIPRGYVTTYGAIALLAGTDARVVGHVMATNPLYPIIPCHRVVGSDFTLVGYTGSQEKPALRKKLDRLRAEARGFTESRAVPTPLGDRRLAVEPVERVLAKAVHDGLDDGGQLSLW